MLKVYVLVLVKDIEFVLFIFGIVLIRVGFILVYGGKMLMVFLVGECDICV